MIIKIATIDDLSVILALQKRAFYAEAERIGDTNIPPMTQTLSSITDDFNNGVILKAIQDNKIVGSVRGYVAEGTLYIGKVIVDPLYQRRGIGSALLRAVEAMYPKYRYELFTGDRNAESLNLYLNNGYVEYKRERYSDTLNFIYLEKNCAKA